MQLFKCTSLVTYSRTFFLFLHLAIEGLPFQVNSKFDILWKKSGVSVIWIDLLVYVYFLRGSLRGKQYKKRKRFVESELSH